MQKVRLWAVRQTSRRCHQEDEENVSDKYFLINETDSVLWGGYLVNLIPVSGMKWKGKTWADTRSCTTDTTMCTR